MTGTAELHELFDEVSKAWADGDVDAFVQRYTEDATAILPGFRLAGRAEILAAMGPALAGPLHATRRRHDLRAVRELAPDVVVVTTASATLAPGETSAPAERQEWATWVLVRGDGKAWQIAAYHGSPVVPG